MTERRPIPIDLHTLFRGYCRMKEQWGLLVHLPENFEPDRTDLGELSHLEHVRLATGYLFDDAFSDHARQTSMQAFADGDAFFFGSEQEVNRWYDQVVGDDGPTQANPYTGPIRVYAMTCNDQGEWQTENT